MNRIESKKNVSIFFDRTDEIADFIKNPVPGSHAVQQRNASFVPYSWEETLDALEHGWEKGVQDMEIASTAFRGEARSYTVAYDVTGQYVDVGRYVDGTPECMGTLDTVFVPARAIDVWVSISHSGRCRPDEIINRGAAMVAWVDSLLDHGHFVTLHFYLGAEKSGGDLKKDIYIEAAVNTQNEYSRNQIAFWLAHPGALRRVMFAVMEIEEQKPNLGGYGCPQNKTDIPAGSIHFPPVQDGRYGTIEEAKRTIEGIIKAADVSIEE